MPWSPPEISQESTGFTPPEFQSDFVPPEFQEKKEPEAEGFLGTAARELSSKLFPALGTAVGGVIGAAGGAAAGAPTIVGAPVGAVAGDIAGGIAGGSGAEYLQRKVMGDQWSDENMAQMEANAKAHPHAAMLGSALPFILSALGGGPAAGARVASKELGEDAAQAAIKKAGESYLSGATGFARSQGAEEAEKKVEGKEGNITEGVIEGSLTGGLMHLIPAKIIKDPQTWADTAKNALYQVTGKAAGDATTMVVANKAYDHFVNGKPFTVGDMVGDSAAATADFALLNSIHAGLELKAFKPQLEAKAKVVSTAQDLNQQAAQDDPVVAAAAQEVIDRAAAKPIVPEAPKEESKEEPLPTEEFIPPEIADQGNQSQINKSAPIGKVGYKNVGTPGDLEYNKSGGWKLHLAVKPENYQAVDEWLSKNQPYGYKLLHGGEPGESDFTIYVGHKDQASQLADKLNGELGHLLDLASLGEKSDAAFNPKVSGRFDVQRKGTPYAYYGHKGIPFDKDAKELEFSKMMSPKEDHAKYDQALEMTRKRIHQDLIDRFGDFYAGTSESDLASGVPLMVTRDMTQQLLDLGYSKADVNKLKPQEAHDIIKSGASKQKPVPAPYTEQEPPPGIPADKTLRRIQPKPEEVKKPLQEPSETDSAVVIPPEDSNDPTDATIGKESKPEFIGAAHKDEQGNVATARDHVTAAALNGVEAPLDRSGRESPSYGFTTEGGFIERPNRKELKDSGHPQYLKEPKGKQLSRRPLLHSDNVDMPNQMSLSDVERFTEDGKPSQPKFEKAYQDERFKEHNETREEFLNRIICL